MRWSCDGYIIIVSRRNIQRKANNPDKRLWYPVLMDVCMHSNETRFYYLCLFCFVNNYLSHCLCDKLPYIGRLSWYPVIIQMLHTYIIYTYIHICIHRYIHAYIHTFIHTYMYTYIHTYIRTWMSRWPNG